jgi:hypothetical protein
MSDVAVRVRATTCAVVLGAVLALPACSGSGQHATHLAAAPAATVRTATCQTWNSAATAQRWRLVRGMREFFGGHVDSPGMRGQVMPNGRAYSLFDAYCGQSFAGAFSLYRVYGNAAAFTIPSN